MSVLFNHARRYEIFNDNPIQFVRQRAKRRKVPDVRSIDEIGRLLVAVDSFSRMLIFLDASTGLRQSELFGLRWRDLNFEIGEINVVRSIVHGMTSDCKTASSMKPVPMGPALVEMLQKW